uniref:Uncharacterized protein n=1 Tax=Syphacia muris TaxID=451379 RepID=A0A0N5AJM0_9BILA
MHGPVDPGGAIISDEFCRMEVYPQHIAKASPRAAAHSLKIGSVQGFSTWLTMLLTTGSRPFWTRWMMGGRMGGRTDGSMDGYIISEIFLPSSFHI